MRGECREKWETLASAMNVMLCYKTRGCRDLVMYANRGDGGGTCMWIHDAHARESQSSAVFDFGSARAEGRVEGGRGDSGWEERGIGGTRRGMVTRGLWEGGGFMGSGDSGEWTVGIGCRGIDRALGGRGGVDADWARHQGRWAEKEVDDINERCRRTTPEEV